ncbi:DUF1731 domain-containing protein [Kiritimatiellaeota bacterium B1221]|nr:DUF1731 domain-containing protein [Kiritimatiellaeota bacterium B1221]
MKKKKMILAGGNGYIGHLLADYFQDKGWECVVLTRRLTGSPREVLWDGKSEGEWIQVLEGGEVLINLCGKSVNCRYHSRNRKELMDSRIQPTRLLGKVLGDLQNPPEVWMNASTATLYRHTFGDPRDEKGEIGSHPDAKDAFSIELAEAWEKAFVESVPEGVRPVMLRSAMVLGRGDDANNVLGVLRRLVRCGLGGKMGHGRQFVSWIHERDFCRAVEWIISHPGLEGPVNLAAPHPLPNREMMGILRARLHRPLGLPASAWMLEWGAFFLRTETELIIKSRRVIGGKLEAGGFVFTYKHFEDAVADLLDF